MKGFAFVAYGETAANEARLAIASLRQHHRREPALVLGEPVPGAIHFESKTTGLTDVQASRWAKVNLDGLPLDDVCYLDADTRVNGDLSAGFRALDDGWDLVITASDHQGDDILWHVDAMECALTLQELCHVPLALQAGVFWFRRNERTRALFAAWREEWRRWQDQDQGALLRALHRAPVRVWLLGRAFNGGAVVGHRFGACRGKR
jgi:hypothetical protein